MDLEAFGKMSLEEDRGGVLLPTAQQMKRKRPKKRKAKAFIEAARAEKERKLEMDRAEVAELVNALLAPTPIVKLPPTTKSPAELGVYTSTDRGASQQGQTHLTEWTPQSPSQGWQSAEAGARILLSNSQYQSTLSLSKVPPYPPQSTSKDALQWPSFEPNAATPTCTIYPENWPYYNYLALDPNPPVFQPYPTMSLGGSGCFGSTSQSFVPYQALRLVDGFHSPSMAH
jgi:hypothetical protein